MENTLVPQPPPDTKSRGNSQQSPNVDAFASSFPQLNFQFVNYGAVKAGVDNVVYIAADTTTNQIDLQVMINTGSSTLVMGDVISPEQLPPTGPQTLLYLDLSPLQLSAAAWKALKPTATGWNCVPYPTDQVIGMAPSQAGVQVQSGSAIAIHLGGIELDQAPASQTPQLSVTYYNVPGVTTGTTSWTSTFTVAIQNPPSGTKDLTQVLAVNLVSNIIVNSFDDKRTVDNTLTLEFSQTSQNIGVPAGKDTLFTISFVYGKAGDTFGYGALTDVPNAQNIVPTKGDNADKWIPTSYVQAESPYWTLQPPNAVPIADRGAQAVVSWNFGPIVTKYQPGPTVMLVQYRNVPGYQDGVFTLVLNKIPHVVINKLWVSPSPAYLKNGKADVTVSWDADYATSLALTQNYSTTDVTKAPNNSVPATLTTQSTTFSLKATGTGADIDNVDFLNCVAIALPVINSFVGAPADIYSGGGPVDIEFYWAVDTTGKVALTSTSGDVSGGGFNAVDHTSATVRKPQMITLAPVTDPGVTGPTRNLIISAFKPVLQTHPAGANTSGAAASPSAPFLALVNPSSNQVIAIDTVQFSQITTVSVGASPSAVVFSQDGSLMVTLNGDKTLSIHNVAITGGTPTFSAVGTVTLPGNPQAAVITPDLSTIYVSVDGQPGFVIAVAKGSNGYATGQQIGIGNAPRGLAIDPSGSRLYIANSGDNTISVVGIGIDGTLQLTGIAQAIGTQPTGLAITPDGATLLAACAGSGFVLAIDAVNPSTGNRQQLAVGSKPTQLAVTPGGAYAFVANSGDGSVSLLDVMDGPLSCSVLQKSIAVGTTPSGIAVSPDGMVVLVADSGSQNFGVLSLQTFAAATIATQIGSQPTDVVVSSDASAALIWHNAMYSGQQSVPGARYFPVASGVATEILADIPMVQCVFAPAPPSGGTSTTAYAIGSMEPLLYVLGLADPANAQETDVQLPVAGHTTGLALSSDGQTLFIVMVDRTQQYTLLIGSVANGNWSNTQSLPLYKGKSMGPIRIAVTPDSSTIFIADVTNHVFTIATRGTGGQYALKSPGVTIADATSVMLLPDGSKAYVLGASSPNTITIIDVATLQPQPVSVLQSYVNLQELIPSPDGRRIYAPDRSAGALRILDPASLRILQTLPLAPAISQAQGAARGAIAPDGSRIFVANSISGTMSVLQQISM